MARDYSNVISKIDLIASKVYNDLQSSEIPYLNLQNLLDLPSF